MNAEYQTDRKYYGIVVALVVEREAVGEGRVKLRFPWFEEGMTTDWCRVAQSYAGNGYGALFVPEEQTEVAVCFIHGDMRHPIVVGGLYNGVDQPSHRPDNKEQKVIRTKGNHEVLLDDTPGERKIVIRDADSNNDVTWDTEQNSITIRSQGGKIVLEADEIEIRATRNLTAEAGEEVAVSSSGTMSMTSSREMSVTSSGDMTLEGALIKLN